MGGVQFSKGISLLMNVLVVVGVRRLRLGEGVWIEGFG